MSYSHKANCRFTVTSWTENLLADIDGTGTTSGPAYYPDRGMSRADVTYSYSGDVEGTSTVAYLITYRGGAAPVLGFERFEGSIGGRAGTSVFQHIGEQDRSSVSARLAVVPGMGTGDLADLRGEAELSISGHCEDGYELALSYDLG